MQVPGLGAFLRALLPVQLTGGHSIRYGVWVGVRPADLHHALEVWWAPEYVDLRLTGYLANEVGPWSGLLGARVEVGVLDADQTPWCVGSEDPALARVLRDEWDHRDVLESLPS